MNKYEIVKFNNDSVEVDVTVSPLEETVWLTQEQRLCYLMYMFLQLINILEI